MIDEKLQFAISQYVDGSLAPAEAAQLEVRFASDAESRRLLEEYRLLDQMVKAAMPEPEMDWDAMARKISFAIDEGETQAPLSLVAGAPATWWRPLAIAASVLVCVSFAAIAWQTMLRQSAQSGGNVALEPPRPQGYAMVDTFRVEDPISSGEIQVQIGQHQRAGTTMLAEMADSYPAIASAVRAKVLIAAVPIVLSDEDSMFMH